jgi:hypothetical protein
VIAWTSDTAQRRHAYFDHARHNNETVGDDRYLDLVARGILWAAGKLDADGKAAAVTASNGGLSGLTSFAFLLREWRKPALH